MSVKIDQAKSHPTDGYQWLYVTLDDVDGDACKYVTSQPFNGDSSGILSGDDLQAYVDSKEDLYKSRVMGIMYQDAVVPRLDGKSDLESFEAWVSAGCKNAEVKGEDSEGEEIVIKAEETISKKAWVDSEPSVDTAALIAELQEKVNALEG